MDANSKVELHTGSLMPVMGLGTWQLTIDTATTIVQALESGYRMIDTSGDYGTQPGIAEGIKRSGMAREDLYIVTKVEEHEDAYEATRRNLDELELDYADLMLVHRPPQEGNAGQALWEGLIRTKEEGLTRDIGVSNYPMELIQILTDTTGEKPAVNQIEWSPLGHSMEMFEFAKQNQIIVQAYSPLTRANRLDNETIGAIAAKYGKTPAQAMIRWNLQLGTVPIPKANQPSHMEENIDVFDFELTPADMEMISNLNEYYSAMGSSLAYVTSKKEESMGYRELIKKVQLYSGFSDKESKEALEHTVESLAGMLTDDERHDFASQLPSELQEIALAAEPVERSDKKDLLQYFMDKQHMARDRAKKHIMSAWQALKDAITPGEIEDIRAQLPNQTAALLR